MSSSLIDYFNFIIQQIYIYFGIPVFILGVIGGFVNIIIFLSLKTFRQSSCAFYLMIKSAFDLGRFFSGIIYNIVRYASSVDWAASSVFYCKFRMFVFTACSLGSMLCLCLAVIDQYFATCARPRWQRWCNSKLAHRLTATVLIICSLHAIPYAVFYNHILASSTNQTICQITNTQFVQYHTYRYFVILSSLLPLVTVFFGFLAFRNARQLIHRTIPLVRRELDKQLTVMVLVQVLISFCTYLPYSIETIFALMILHVDTVYRAQTNLVSGITFNFSVLSFATPFYTYVCTSKRFRRQVKHVFCEIYFKRRRAHQIAPDP